VPDLPGCPVARSPAGGGRFSLTGFFLIPAFGLNGASGMIEWWWHHDQISG